MRFIIIPTNTKRTKRRIKMVRRKLKITKKKIYLIGDFVEVSQYGILFLLLAVKVQN